MAITLIGILLIFSAQYGAESEFERTFFMRQLSWLPVALTIFLIIIHIPIRTWDLLAYVLYGFAVFLLVAVLFVGTNIKDRIDGSISGRFTLRLLIWRKSRLFAPYPVSLPIPVCQLHPSEGSRFPR
jgi:hypothetical protein